MWQVSKNGNSALQAFYFWKYLLTVGGDEQQEMAISPLLCFARDVAVTLSHLCFPRPTFEKL